MDTCKYVHYEIDSLPEAESSLLGPQAGTTELGLHAGDADSNVGKLFPSQVRKRRGLVRWQKCINRFVDSLLCGTIRLYGYALWFAVDLL